MSNTEHVLPTSTNDVGIDDMSNVLAGNTVGIDPSEVVIELEALSAEERESILIETANSTDTDSVREDIQEALDLIQIAENEKDIDVAQNCAELVQRVKTARHNSSQSEDIQNRATLK